jgi:hypothetical protein
MHINSTITNVQSKPAQWLGKDYMVVPVIMAVEGVHNGSTGPMFYPANELQSSSENWTGVPVTVQHPKNEKGQFIMAVNAPEFIIGHIQESLWDGKLRAEAWIDIEKANLISTDIMTIIRGNGQLEVSTGLLSEDEITKGDWKGEAYEAIVRNIIPDHLALLPGEKGACSWVDGCGIRANKKKGRDSRTYRSWDNMIQRCTNPRAVNYKYYGKKGITVIKKWKDSFDVFLADMGTRPAGKSIHRKDSKKGYFPGNCTWATPKEQGKAKSKKNKGGEEKYMKFKGFEMEVLEQDAKEIPKSVLRAFLNNQLGEEAKWEGKFKTNELSHGNVRSQIQAEINSKDTQNQYHFVRDVFDKYFVYSREKEGQKLQLFKQGYNLAANDEVEFVGDEVEVIEKTEYIKINKEEGTKMSDKEKKVFAEKAKALIANEKSSYVEEDQDWLETMEEAQLDKLIANVGITEDAEKTLVTAAVEKAFDDAVNSGEVIKVEKKDPDKKKPPTVDDFIANAPAEMQDVLQSGLDMHRDKKVALVTQILANEQNKFTQVELEGKGVSELTNIAALIPLQKVEDDGVLSYAANSAGSPGVSKEDPMEMPSMEVKK